jgi:hypothetical protein
MGNFMSQPNPTAPRLDAAAEPNRSDRPGSQGTKAAESLRQTVIDSLAILVVRQHRRTCPLMDESDAEKPSTADSVA